MADQPPVSPLAPNPVFIMAMQRVLAIHYPLRNGSMQADVCAQCSAMPQHRMNPVPYPCDTAKPLLDAGVIPLDQNGTLPGR